MIWRADQGIPPLDLVGALFLLGGLPEERLPWFAAQWLADGHDGPALLELACLDGTDLQPVRELLPEAMAELQPPMPATIPSAAETMFRHIAHMHLAGQGDERWVARKVEEVHLLTAYRSDVIALPLGQLYDVADCWDEDWGPSLEELKATVYGRCTQQLNSGGPHSA